MEKTKDKKKKKAEGKGLVGARPKASKLTTKQRKLVKGVAAGKTQKVAALEAGYSPKNAESIASHELKKTQVKAAITELMEEMGLDDRSLLKAHKELIEATKVISAMSSKEANGGTVDFIDVPDHQARAKGLEMAYKLKGSFAADKHEHAGKDGEPFVFNFTLVPGAKKEN